MGSPGVLEELATASYVAVTSYRKDGTGVPTPVWVAGDGDALVVWTVTDSWKVKRIRRNPLVTVAPCDVRGKPSGEAVGGTAEILDQAGTDRVRVLIRRKYGLFGRLTLAMSRLRRGATGTVGVRITLAS